MTQIFKTKPPTTLLFSFLAEICDKTDKCFIFDKNAYKRAIYNDQLTTFLETCKPHYHVSKQTYVERKPTYNSLITIIRQICNINKIGYASEIKYDKSLHTIVYYIYTNSESL